MDEYSDLKFDGDLSFLNENVDAAKKDLEEERAAEENKDPNYNSKEQLSTTQRKERMEMGLIAKSNEQINPVHSNNKPTQEQNNPTQPKSMEKSNDTTNIQSNDSNSRNEKYSNQDIMKDNTPHYNGKKSQLEEMVLNSGYGPELFNNLKMELLELEKEKIIMKYKQDLMMIIIKS